MMTITNILTHTPPWVFPLITAVIWLGSLSLRERTVTLRLLFVLPEVLLAMSIGNAIGTAAHPLSALAGWTVSLAVGGAIGWSTSRERRSIDPSLRACLGACAETS